MYGGPHHRWLIKNGMGYARFSVRSGKRPYTSDLYHPRRDPDQLPSLAKIAAYLRSQGYRYRGPCIEHGNRYFYWQKGRHHIEILSDGGDEVNYLRHYHFRDTVASISAVNFLTLMGK